jgi:AcrR family transcriptional regulator
MVERSARRDDECRSVAGGAVAADPRRPKSERTRRALLESAVRTIGREGFSGATVSRITAGAGVAVGTLYLHFPSRQHLFDDVLTHVREAMLRDVGPAVRGATGFLDVEQRGFVAFFKHLHRNPWYIRIETEARIWARDTYEAHVADLAQRYVRALRRCKRQGEFAGYAEDELEALAYMLMSARKYLAMRYIMQGDRARPLPRWLRDAYMQFVTHGLAGRAETE